MLNERDVIANEADLICRQVGLLVTNLSMSVCPLHRAKLGVDFKQANTCSHPTHRGKGKEKAFRSATTTQSKEMLEDHGVLVPVGSGL